MRAPCRGRTGIDRAKCRRAAGLRRGRIGGSKTIRAEILGNLSACEHFGIGQHSDDSLDDCFDLGSLTPIAADLSKWVGERRRVAQIFPLRAEAGTSARISFNFR
jgi:hypothetical protein